jgi:Mrp family chromosome partitioning ATPase
MGFLSRKSKPEDGRPQTDAVEPIEIEAAESRPEPEREQEDSPREHAATPPEPEGEEITVSEGHHVAVAEREDPEPEEEPEEPRRLKPSEIIAPSRRDAAAQSGGEEEQPTKRAEVIAFANQKGGVAKTTTTLNLAVAFAESGHRVLCVDLDPQGNLTMSQGIDPDKVEKSLYDVLVHDLPISEVIAHREIDIAVSSIDLAGAEIAMSTKIGRERSL